MNQRQVTERNTTMQLPNPTQPTSIQNLPVEAQNLRTLPNNAGFGVANEFQGPREMQVQLRFAF